MINIVHYKFYHYTTYFDACSGAHLLSSGTFQLRSTCDMITEFIAKSPLPLTCRQDVDD